MGYFYKHVWTDPRYWEVKGHIHVTICRILCVQKEERLKERKKNCLMLLN